MLATLHAYRSRLLSWALVGLFAHSLTAQDYSGGIARFLQLGLPDVKDATYVKVSDGYGGSYSRFGDREGPKLEGNGWLLSTNTNGISVVLVNHVTKQKRIDRKVQEKRQQERMEAMQSQAVAGEPMEFVPDELDRMSPAKYKVADLRKDLDTLIAHLKKPAAAKRNRYSMSRQNWSGHFLFAAHAHRKGFKQEANEIIALVMQKGGGSRKVLSGAMNQVADALYEESYATFEKTGDWSAYLKQMRQLVAQFPGVWRNAPLVKRVIGEVDAHLKRKEAPAIQGENLTAEDRELAAQMADAKRPLKNSRGAQNWIAFNRSYGPDTNSVMARIQARGMKSVPLLLALLGDTYLVRTGTGGGYSSVSYSFPDSAEMFMDEDMIDQMYQHFSRPKSRGEIARGMLEPLVLKQEEQHRPDMQLDDDELKQRTAKWYAENKDKSRSELIRGYLDSGERYEQQQAFQQLLYSDEEEDRKVLERFVLATTDMGQALRFATQLVQHHGDKASAFAKTFVAKAKQAESLISAEQLEYADAEMKKRYAEQAKNQLKNLEAMISDQTAPEMMDEFLADKEKWTPKKWAKSAQVFNSKLQAMKADDVLSLLLKGAVAARDDTLANSLLQAVSQVQYRHMQRRRPGVSEPKPFKPKLADHLDLWKQLIAQKRKVDTRNWGSMMNGVEFTFRKQVATMVESLYGDTQHQARQWQMMEALGPRVMDVMVERAEARLAGKADDELPAYPDKDSVKADRRATIKQQLSTIEPAKAGDYIKSLSLSEVLHVADFFTEDPKLNQRFAGVGNRINGIPEEIKNAELKQTLTALQGKAFDRPTLEQLVELGKKLVKSGEGGLLMISRSTPLAGVSIGLLDLPEDMGMGMGNRAMVNASLQGQGTEGRVYGHAMWQVEMPKPKQPEKKKTETKKDDTAAKIKAALAAGDTDALEALLENSDPSALASALGEDAKIDVAFDNEYQAESREKFFEQLGQVLDPKANLGKPFNCTLMLVVPQPGQPGAGAGLHDIEFDIVP